MSQMSTIDLLNTIDLAIADTTAKDGSFMQQNEDLLDRYEGNAYGDELPERSKVISNDVMDVVEADMPPLARIFLGPGEVLKFKPNKRSNQEDVEEADQKSKYVDWQIRQQPWSFGVLHGFIKAAEIQKTAVVKYFIEETSEVEEHKKTGYSAQELAMFEDSLQGEDVESVEITERGPEDENGTFDVKFKVSKKRKSVVIRGVPLENFLITRNAESKDEAELVGDVELTTRGDLLKRGFPRSKIDKLPLAGAKVDDQSRLKDIRDEDEGGSEDRTASAQWASEKVELFDLYMPVDWDGDGIAERRHILKSGDIVLVNEVFNHVPYAIQSTILMPHKAIGKSRAEITAPTARIKTAVMRGMMDNIYAVNAPQIVSNKNVNFDDLLIKRPNGQVRTKHDGPVQNDVMPLMTPSIAREALTVIQYLDHARAQTTGSLMASQGLDADDLGKETATRFEGVQDQSDDKIELVARVIAETGMRQLYEGVAWLDENFQDSETEIEVLGQELTVNPADWKFKHSVVSNVGVGAGDDEETLATMTFLLQTHKQLKAEGSPLTDVKKEYNILSRIAKAANLPDVSEFYNDPERPEELIQAENDILRKSVEVMQGQVQQLQNPLAEAETIKAQAKLVEAQGKRELDIAQMLEDQRQFNVEQARLAKESNEKLALQLTEIEAKFAKELSQQNNQNKVDNQ